MIETRVNLARVGGVTFVHVLPRLRVMWINPSSEPAHITSAFSGDSASANTVAYHSVPVMSYVIGPPAATSVFGSWSVRAELIGSPLAPSFVDRKMRFAAT